MLTGKNGKTNIITIIDNVFDEEYLSTLDKFAEGELLHLDSSGNHVGDYTEYEWKLIKNNIRTSPDRYKLLNKISSIVGEEVPTEDLEPLQLFAKKFTSTSFIDKHKESPDTYGDWVYMLYLSNEIDGELCTDSLRILPKRNRLVLMRTGFEHWVEPCSGSRANISGWPFATAEVRKKWKDKDSTQIS